jgi:hypothetical protein
MDRNVDIEFSADDELLEEPPSGADDELLEEPPSGADDELLKEPPSGTPIIKRLENQIT